MIERLNQSPPPDRAVRQRYGSIDLESSCASEPPTFGSRFDFSLTFPYIYTQPHDRPPFLTGSIDRSEQGNGEREPATTLLKRSSLLAGRLAAALVAL